MSKSKEYRNFTVEYRVAPETRVASGYAAVFNVPTDLGRFREQIADGAFTRAIAAKQDVRALLNHNPDNVLGRTKSDTLTLSQDSRGLKFDISMPDTNLGRDVHTLVQRGDIDQCSFGFIVQDETVTYDADGRALRTIRDADLFDVSIVTYPAYESTSVEARSRDEVAERTTKLSDVDVPCECPCGECQSDGDCSDCSVADCDCISCDCHDEEHAKVMDIEIAKARTYLAGLE